MAREPFKRPAQAPQNFVVAKGQAITTPERGILTEGMEVVAADLHGGEAAFSDLRKRDILVPAPETTPAPPAATQESNDAA